jgi:dethiobiotin synthetase
MSLIDKTPSFSQKINLGTSKNQRSEVFRGSRKYGIFFRNPLNMPSLFITGTDTDVGKTWFTALLTRSLRQQDIAVSVRKPVASGCENGCPDAEILASASGEDTWQVCPYRFKPAISPERAMRLTNQPYYLKDLQAVCQSSTNPTLIEGAGGLLSPICLDGNNADLAQALNLPLLLVAANKTGCINHTLLTLEAIKKRHLTCMGIILNNISPDSDPDNLTDLVSRVMLPVWSLPYQVNKLPNELLTLVEQLFRR